VIQLHASSINQAFLRYLAIDELIAENPQMTAGNYGLLDAIAALKWVQTNIGEFNGDPDHVMLFGTSSGGILSCIRNQTIGDVAFIVGMAHNELGSRFQNLSIPDDATYQIVLSNIFSSPLDTALYTLYPSANYPTPKDAFLEAFSDLIFSCNGESLAFNAMDGTPSYLYEITRGFDTGTFAGAGAYHAIDIPYLFGSFDVYGYTPDAQALAIRDAMRTAWRSLAADPTAAPAISTDGTTLWPAFDPATASYVEFGDTVAGTIGHRGSRCSALRDAL
jgi:carboxylesterase type B